MFISHIFVVVSLMNILRDLSVSGCDTKCADKPVFTPSTLVVQFGDPTSASCSACQHECKDSQFDIEKSLGKTEKNGTLISWTVDEVTDWDPSPTCFYTNATQYQCCTNLPVTVYKPPDNVSVSFVNHTGPMFEGHQYTLLCTVKKVAPIKSLTVTFYKGQTALGQRQSEDTEKKPRDVTFPLDIIPSKKDDGAQYWCEAKLKLGPEGPQPPPVVMSQKVPATVYYEPRIESSAPDTITITEGNPLQLNCSAVGNPSPSYTWTLPSDDPPPSNSSILTINSVTFMHQGLYTCAVSNSRGTVTKIINVQVQVNVGIIIAVIAGVLFVVAVILGLLIYFYCYKPTRMGQYNLKDVLRLRKQHSTVPCGE